MYKTIVNTTNDFAIISKKTVQYSYEQKSIKKHHFKSYENKCDVSFCVYLCVLY